MNVKRTRHGHGWRGAAAIAAVFALAACGSADSEDSNASQQPDDGDSQELPTVPVTTESVDQRGDDPAPDRTPDELFDLPIDELPTSMYAVEPCVRLQDEPPIEDASGDYPIDRLTPEEIIERSPVVVHATVSEVGEATLFVPSGVPAEFLEMSGALEPSELAFGGTPVTLTVIEVFGDAIEPGTTVGAVFFGCWAPDAVNLTTSGSEVLILADRIEERDAGTLSLVGAELRVLDWFAVDADRRLATGPNVLGLPVPSDSLRGLDLDEAIATLEAARPGS